MAAKDGVGRYGERLAARYLTESGLQVVQRNWRSPDRDVPGELDIIALDGDTTVVVEVKTRRSEACGSALEAVTPAKLGRLRRLAGVYLRTTQVGTAGVRIDVVTVRRPPTGAAVVSHLRAVG